MEKLYLHLQWGPDKHNKRHQRGATSKAVQTHFCAEKNDFKNYQKLLNLWLDNMSNHFLINRPGVAGAVL